MERWKAPKELGFRSQVGSPEPGAQPSDPQASSSPEPSALPAALEPSVKIANLRQRLHMISRTGKTGIHFDAISDLIEEARFNKSAIVDDACAATELKNLLAMPWPSRRAWSLRELTEFGRNIDFPPAWHGSDRMRSVVWYHALQRLKLVEFNENDIMVRQGQLGSCAYWLLSEGAVYRSTPGVKRLELLRALEQAAAAAEAPAPSAASFTRPSLGLRRPSQLSQLNSPGMDGLRTSMTTSLQPSAMNSPAPQASQLSQPHALPSPSPSPAAHPPVPPLAPASSCTSTTISRSASLAPPSARLPRISLTAGVLEHTPRVHAGRQPSMHLLLERGEQLGLTPEQRAAAVAAAAGGGSSIGAEEEEEEEEEEDVPDVALDVWDIVGQEALQGRKSRANVVATAKLVCACLSADDYHAVLNEVLASETFDSLKLVHSMITQKAQRTPAQLQDMAAQLALFDLFHTMDEDFRLEVCRLVEYLHCPEGFVLFEEGDKIDFCYVVLQGKVVFNKYNDKARRQDEIGTKSTGEHFGTLLTLSSGEKKRPFTAITASRCEMAIISRVGYNRILKKQLQGAISARISLLQSLNVMNANSYQALQRVAINCQDETFHAGATIVEPANYPNKLFVIMEGEAKLTYVTEYPNQMPLDTMASTHPQVKQPTAAELMAPDPPTTTKRHDHAATGGRVSMGGGRAGGARNSSNVRDGQRDGADGGASSGGGVASTAAEARARDALATAQQLEGGTHRGAASQGLRLAGTRRKVVIEVARLSKGDVFNGVTLFGKAPVFSVVACTPMRLVSLEADSVEGFVGREATRALKSLVSQSHSWAMQRLAQMLSVRQTVDACIMDPATHRVMHANAQRNFMEHYVPSGVTEMLASAAEQRQQQWEAAGGSGPAPGAAPPHPHPSMASPAPPLASPHPPPGALYPGAGAGAGAGSALTQALGTGSALGLSLLAPGPSYSMAEIRSMEDVMRLPTTTVFAPRGGKRPTHLGHAPPGPASHTGKGTGGRRADPSGPPAAASTPGAAATGAGAAPLPPQATLGDARGSPPAPLPSAGASGQVQAAAAWPGGSGGKVGGLGVSRQRRRRGRARHMVWAGQMATALLDVSEEGQVPCRQPPWAPHALAAAANMEAPTLGAPRPLAGSDQAAVTAKGGMGGCGTGSGEGEEPGQAGQAGGHQEAVLAGLALGQQGCTAAPLTSPLPPSLPKSPAAAGGSTAAGGTAAGTAGGRPPLPAPLLPGCPSSPRFELPMSLTLTLNPSRSSRGCAPHLQDPSPPADSDACPPLSPGPPTPPQQQQQLGTPLAQGQQPPSASALFEDRGITPQLTAAAQPLRHLPHPGPSAASPTQRTGLAQYGGSTPPPDSRDPSRSSTPLTGSTGAGHSQDGVAAPGAAASCGQAEGQRGHGLTHEATAGGGGSGRRLASPLASTKRDLEPAPCLAAAAGVGAGAGVGVGVGGSLAAGGGSVGRIQGGGSVASEAVRGAGGAGREVREPMGLAGRPRLPPAVSPVLASPSLTASVIMQPATSPGTAMYSRRRNATIASGAVTAQGELDLDPPTPRQPSTPAPPWPPAALPTHAPSTHSTATYGLLGQGGTGGPLSSQVSFPTTLSAESSGWPVTGREPAGNALPWLPDLGAGLGPEPSWLSSSSGQQQQEGQPGRGAAATVDTVVILPDRLSVYQHSFADGAEASFGSFPRSHGRLGRRGHAHDAAAKQRQQDVSITGSVPDMSSRGPWRIQLASQASDVALSLPQESSTARSDNVMARAAPDDVNVLKQSYASRRKLRASTDGSKGMSAQRGVVRMIAVSKDHEPTLPLDCDQTAPLLNDHKLSRPTLEDINYILHRWGTRWASEREEELAQRRRAPEVFDTLTPRTKDAVTAKTEYELIFDRPSAQLGLFGLPAPDASQNGMIWKDS